MLATRLAHESIHKACRLLGLELVDVRLREGAVMDATALRRLANDCSQLQGRRLIVVATVGATLKGNYDLVDKSRWRYRKTYHAISMSMPPSLDWCFHLLNRLAGSTFVLPLSIPSPWTCTRCARLPLGAGVFLARPGLTDVLATKTHLRPCG